MVMASSVLRHNLPRPLVQVSRAEVQSALFVRQAPVATSQVAPTILQALHIEPEALNSLRVEHTAVLPGIWDNRGGDDQHGHWDR
jgi:hypothetical protein